MKLRKTSITIGVVVKSSSNGQGGDITKPAFDSGWIKSDGDFITVNHNLNTSNLFIYLMYKNNNGIFVADRDLIQGIYINDNSAKIRTMGFKDNEYFRLLLWILKN